MGYTTRESDSLPLTKLYPSFYNETQVNNWTPVDLVITDLTGKQTVVPKWPSSIMSAAPYAELSIRECTGYRVSTDNKTNIQKDIPIPTKTYTVPYEDFVLYPVQIKEAGIIISTTEHSLIAKNMVTETTYCPAQSEYVSDFELTDPRFVYEVRDTCNRWDMLYLNVMGQTIKVKCSHGNKIPDIDNIRVQNDFGECTLKCYLRYPSNSQMGERETVPVFTINLKDLDLEEPYIVPSGDIICVASSEEALQRVIAKKNDHTHGRPQIQGMMSLEVHEQTVKNLEKQLEDTKKDCQLKIQSVSTRKDAEIIELRTKVASRDREIESLKSQNEQWKSLHAAQLDRVTHEDKLLSQLAKSRDEEYDRLVKRSDHTMDTIKVIGAAVVAVAGLGMAIYKTKKG